MVIFSLSSLALDQRAGHCFRPPGKHQEVSGVADKNEKQEAWIYQLFGWLPGCKNGFVLSYMPKTLSLKTYVNSTKWT